MTEDLATWLLSQIDEDARTAEAAPGSEWHVGDGSDEYHGGNMLFTVPAAMARLQHDGVAFEHDESARHAARWDPRRVLAECDAKRQIVEHAAEWFKTLRETPEGWTEQGATAYRMAMEWTLRRLTPPYVDRRGYRAEWRP